MSTQPEAMRLADALTADDFGPLTNEAATELCRLHEANQELLEALEMVVTLASETHDHWDNDRDAKVGKILIALSGHLPGYDKRIDALHAAIAKATGEK